MSYSIIVKTLSAQPVLVMRRVKRTEVARALGQLLGGVFLHAQRCGAGLVGQPFTRYLEWGPGVLSLEAGLPIAAAVSGEGQVLSETLQGGSAAVAMHAGGYEGLFDAHVAVQAWIEERGYHVAGAP